MAIELNRFFMNKCCLKFGLILLFIGISQNIMAHDIPNGVLGPLPSASDYYLIECRNDESGAGDSVRLEVTLTSLLKNGPVVSLQVKTENPLYVTNITDAVGGDKTSSMKATVANDNNGTANGFYYFTVNKSKAGIQKYQIKFHCLSKSGHAGTEESMIQNQ
jgi:hypothetical protein